MLYMLTDSILIMIKIIIKVHKNWRIYMTRNEFIKFVQARKHKKRKINKKWLKRYGYKQIIVKSKGWKMKTDTNGNVEFIK